MTRAEQPDRRADQLRTELVRALALAGVFPDPVWQDAFQQVPRHVFVPAYDDVSGLRVSGDDPRLREEWLAGVYSDRALITQRTGFEPTSSSSQPSLMAGMLCDLHVEDDSRVLEIGTGTGYNAALLTHRLGAERVTSIDVSPELTALARGRLAETGYQPYIATGDGALGYPDRAPYDRLIATCRVDAVPPAWLEQVTEGGRILTPLGYSLLRLRVTGEHTAEGRFLGNAFFMPLRHPRADGVPASPPPDEPPPAPALPPSVMTEPSFRFLLSVIEPFLDEGSETREDETRPTQAGAVPTAEEISARRRERIEEAYEVFNDAGAPGPERFGITADGPSQRLWLDHPDGPSWALYPRG